MPSRSAQRGSESTSQYRGVRMRRWGKWVSEIRDSQKKKRIWLGSFRSESEAAHAFDAAALMCLRNPLGQLNFPDHYYELPASGSPGHYSTRQIQAAAAAAAAASVGRSFSYHQFMSSSTTSTSSDSEDAHELEDITYTESSPKSTSQFCSYAPTSACTSSYFDEDHVDLVSELARGLLMQPPAPSDDDDDDDNVGYTHYTGLSLWN